MLQNSVPYRPPFNISSDRCAFDIYVAVWIIIEDVTVIYEHHFFIFLSKSNSVVMDCVHFQRLALKYIDYSPLVICTIYLSCQYHLNVSLWWIVLNSFEFLVQSSEQCFLHVYPVWYPLLSDMVLWYCFNGWKAGFQSSQCRKFPQH